MKDISKKVQVNSATQYYDGDIYINVLYDGQEYSGQLALKEKVTNDE